MFKKIGVNLLLLTFSVSLVLAPVEIFLRVRDKAKWSDEGLGWVGEQTRLNIRSKNKKLIFEYQPNTTIELWDVPVSTNFMGYRDKDYSLKKPEDVFRVAVVGDSVPFGYKLASEDTYVKKLEALLNEQKEPKGKYEVLNMGISGYNTEQEVELFLTRGIQFEPDLVILNYTVNDNEFMSDGGLGGHFVKTETPLRTLGFLKLKWIKIQEKYFDAGTKSVQKSLQRLAKISTEKQMPVLVLVQPVLRDYEAYPEYKEFHAFIHAEARKHDFDVLDLYELFQKQELPQITINYLHPNALGHALIAQALLEHVNDRYLPL